MATGHALFRPPPHLQGNLVFHRPAKFGLISRSKQFFFVLLEAVLHRYDSQINYYKGERSTKEHEIPLEEVCGITEVLLPSKPYKNCSFSLTLYDSTEHIFSAESREAMEQWVNGLKAAKEFWTQHNTRMKIKQKLKRTPDEPVSVHNGLAKLDDSISNTSSEDDKLITQVHVTTWDGVMHKILLPLIFDAEELLSALNGKVQGSRCANCPICKLQQSSMEVWTVTDTGIGKKLDHKSDAIDVSKHGQHFYLLVHNYKLLIIHFEDGTFQVLPRLVSLRAKEVPYLPIFADKLSPLGFTNFGLFLVTESGASFLFDPEEEPLKHSLKGRLLLKNRALTVPLPVSPTSLDIHRQQLKKKQQNRKNKRALEKAEEERCKQNSNFPMRNTNSNSPHDLLFCFDHYSRDDVQNEPDASNYAQHTNIAQSSSNEERICDLTERNSTEEEKSSTEIKVLNTDECPVGDQETDGDLHEKGKDECIERSVAIVTKRCEERIVQENEQNLLRSPHMDNRAHVGSLEHPNRLAENGSSSEQMKESVTTEGSYRHVNETLFKDDTWEIRTKDQTSLIDDNSKKSDVTTEALETKVQPNLTNNELVNHKSNASTFGIGTFKTLAATNEENTTPQNATDRDAAIDGCLAAKNDEMAAQKNETDGDASIKSYRAATGGKMPGTTSNDSDSSSSSSREEAPSHETSHNLCKERPHFEIHQCDYTIVGTPRILEIALKVCSGHKVNEEEVGEANIYTRICLSGWHLRCENGSWSLVERGGRLPVFNDSLSSTVKVQVTKKLEACFHKEEELWTVVENEHFANESWVAKNVIENRTLNNALEMPEDASKFQGAGSNSGSDVLLSENKLQGDATFNKSSLIANAIQRQSLNRTLNVLEDVFQDREVAPKAGPDKSLGAVSKNLDGVRRNKSCEVLLKSGLPSFQEAIHAAIQGIFHHMSEFNELPEEALDDSKHESIVESVCEPLCRALWNVLSVGLRKRMLLGKYTVWNIVENFKDVSSHVRRIVDWVNNKYACFEEPQKFQAFVCECLNIRQGTLHWWLESLLSQKELGKYYGQDGLMFQLPRAKLEVLVLDLKRISSLPFELHSEKWIKKHGYDLNRPAFTFE